jgi:hypothetical protein
MEPRMTSHTHHDGVLSRTSSQHSARRHSGRSRRTPVTSGPPPAQLPAASTDVHAEELWERHGGSAYAIACVLLGDSAAAGRAVEQAMADLAQSPVRESAREARRSMARHVYRRSQNLSADTSRTLRMPPAMVWISQLAQLQRSCLALCLFGGHTHREAAALLGVTPTTAAGLLTSGLTELGRLAASDPAPG